MTKTTKKLHRVYDEKGMIIDYVKAMTDKKATEFAKKIWGDQVFASRVNTTKKVDVPFGT